MTLINPISLQPKNHMTSQFCFLHSHSILPAIFFSGSALTLAASSCCPYATGRKPVAVVVVMVLLLYCSFYYHCYYICPGLLRQIRVLRLKWFQTVPNHSKNSLCSHRHQSVVHHAVYIAANVVSLTVQAPLMSCPVIIRLPAST